MQQLPLWQPSSSWEAPNLSTLPEWPEHGRVAIDCETRDEKLHLLGPGFRRGGYVVGVSFAIEGGPAHYLPFRHGMGDNLDEGGVLRYLGAQAKRFKGELVGANLTYDHDGLLNEGIEFKPKWWRDVQIAAPLIDELHDRFSLDHLAGRWGIEGKDSALLEQAATAWSLDPKKGLWRLPARFVGDYAERDVTLPLELLKAQERNIEAQGLQDIFDLESRVLPVTVKMRRRGVAIDFDQLDKVDAWALEQEKEALSEIHRLTAIEIGIGNTNKPEIVGRAIEKTGLKLGRTRTGKPQIHKGYLETSKNEVAQLVVRAREMDKLRGTFVKSIRTHTVNGRIHCTFNQLLHTKDDGSDRNAGAAWGRFSCSDPNLQQQPARHDEIGPMWRAIYIPDEGGEWCCADWSQQEPRWTTHYAELTRCRKAETAAQMYRDDPTVDSHQMTSDMTGLPRTDAKHIFLGVCYGMGAAKLCRKLGLPTDRAFSRRLRMDIEVAGPEGEALMEQFHERMPYLRQLARKCERRAKKIGVIRTVLGRHCHFPKDGKGEFDWTYKALNRLIQGTSGDQSKAALVEADRAGIPVQLQVHDEFDWTCHDREQGHQMATIMREIVPCNVPMKVDLEFGPNWGNLTKEKAA